MNKQQLLPYTLLTDWFLITEMESVYCTVWTEALYRSDYISYLKGSLQIES